MNPPKTLKSKRYPVFIRDNSTIKKYPEPIKKFTKTGILNGETKYTHKSKLTLTQYVAILCRDLKNYSTSMVSAGWANHFNNLTKLISQITVSSIKKSNILVMPIEIKFYSSYRGKKVLYKKGTSLLSLIASLCRDYNYRFGRADSVYHQLLDSGIDLQLSWNKSLKIVFSDHPWDIATMSMRGINSCQAWGKIQSPALIGSILDPNMAIVYLTDGKAHKSYGQRMLARCVVRLVVPSSKYGCLTTWSNQFYKTWIPTTTEERKRRMIFFEGSYADFSSGTCPSKKFDAIFRNHINSAAKKKPTYVKTVRESDFIYSIPSFPGMKKLKNNQLSYRDSELAYIPAINE